MSTSVHLDDASVETLARRVAELLLGKEIVHGGLLDAVEVARRFEVSRDYVYRHADELGAVRLGTGRKPRLRFDPAKVAEALRGSDWEERQRKSKSVRRRPKVTLLPIRESP